MLHIASRRSDAHFIAANRRSSSASDSAEVSLQHEAGLSRIELVVGDQSAEVEQRAVESGIVPVDQPQPLAVVDEIGRQQIVVAEHDGHRAEFAFETTGAFEESAQQPDMTACARMEFDRVAANDMEHPEHQRRPAQMARYLFVATLDQIHRGWKQFGVAHQFGG